MPFIKPFRALAVFLSLLFIFGCSNDAEDSQKNFGLVASEKTLPTNFHEIAFERDTTPYFQYLIEKAVNQSEFAEMWDIYGFENQSPHVDFNKKDVLFIGVQESGSCPYEIKKIDLGSNKKDMTVPLSTPDGACTSDATPRTFVIELNKEVSTDLKNVVIIENGAVTIVPIDGN